MDHLHIEEKEEVVVRKFYKKTKMGFFSRKILGNKIAFESYFHVLIDPQVHGAIALLLR